MRNLFPIHPDDRDWREPDAVVDDPVREMAEAMPDWETVGRDLAARYPYTLARLAE
jgi:hypothetical protein